MLKLIPVIYIIAASTLAGILIIAALTVGRVDATTLTLAAALGAVLALPVSWFVAVKLSKLVRPT